MHLVKQVDLGMELKTEIRSGSHQHKELEGQKAKSEPWGSLNLGNEYRKRSYKNKYRLTFGKGDIYVSRQM